MLDPAPDGDMIHRNPALGHHLLQVAVAQRIPQVPPHAQNDDDIVKVSPSERRWSGPAHRITLLEDREPFATDPLLRLSTRSSGMGGTRSCIRLRLDSYVYFDLHRMSLR